MLWRRGVRPTLEVAFALLLATAIGCGGGSATGPTSPPPPPPPPPPPEPMVSEVEVSPSSAELDRPGRRLQFTATVRDQFGDEMPGVSVTWSSTNGEIATVEASGVAAAVAEGNVDVQAAAEGVTGAADLSVAFDYDIDGLWGGIVEWLGDDGELVFMDVIDREGEITGDGNLDPTCPTFLADGVRDGDTFRIEWDCGPGSYALMAFEGEVRLALARDGTVRDTVTGGIDGAGCVPLGCPVVLTRSMETTLFVP